MLKSTIVRILAFAALFAYIMPFAFNAAGFGSSIAFTGSILAALGVGVAYVAAMFAVAFVWSLVTAPFKLSVASRKKLWPLTGASFFVATAAFLLYSPAILGLSVGLLPALIGAGISLVVMHYTMFDFGKDATD